MGLLSALGSVADLALGGTGIIGGLLGGFESDQASDRSAQAQRDINAQNLASTKEQMEFQERMSSTAYQRATKDMSAAGLNPMLAFSQGGASTPGGASVKLENPAAVGMGSAAQAASVASSLQAMQASQANIEQVRATTDKIRSETIDTSINSAAAAARLKREQLGVPRDEDINRITAWSLKDAQRTFSAKDDGNSWADDVRKRKAEASLAELEIPQAKAQAGMYEQLGKTAPELKWLFEILRGFRGAAGR